MIASELMWKDKMLVKFHSAKSHEDKFEFENNELLYINNFELKFY